MVELRCVTEVILRGGLSPLVERILAPLLLHSRLLLRALLLGCLRAVIGEDRRKLDALVTAGTPHVLLSLGLFLLVVDQ